MTSSGNGCNIDKGLQNLGLGRPRTLQVTSPGAGEGKTITSVNLATAMALDGKRVAVPKGSCTDRFAQAVFKKESVTPGSYLNQSIEVITSGFRAGVRTGLPSISIRPSSCV